MSPVVARTVLCHGCRTLKPCKQMIHPAGEKLYCSQGCAAKAQWVFSAIPLPRSA